MSRHSIIRSMRFQEFLNIPEEQREAITGIWMGEALANERFRYSQRLANQKKTKGFWEHALIEREGRKESWIMFKPDNGDARKYHSFEYWEHAWEEGETILCSGSMMSWNILCPTDKVIFTVRKASLERMSEWDFACELKKISEQYGI